MSTITVENILQQVIQLPRTEQRRLAHLIEEQQAQPTKPPLDKRVPCEPMRDRTREKQWVEEHRHEYAGQWVALDGDQLVASSPVQQEVWDVVRTDMPRRPLVLRIPSLDDLPYIGI